MYVDNNLPFLLEQSGKKGMKWGVRRQRPSTAKKVHKYANRTAKAGVHSVASGAAYLAGRTITDNVAKIKYNATKEIAKAYINSNGGFRPGNLEVYKNAAAVGYKSYQKTSQLTDFAGKALTAGGTIGLAASGASFVYNGYRFALVKAQLAYEKRK